MQATLLTSRGSPWAVRWFFVKPTLIYRSAMASERSLQQIAQPQQSIQPASDQQISALPPNGTDRVAERTPAETSDAKGANGVMPVFPAVVLAVVFGVVVGRYTAGLQWNSGK